VFPVEIAAENQEKREAATEINRFNKLRSQFGHDRTVSEKPIDGFGLGR